ncbi:MAG: hypothetical protein ACEPOV_12135 [Hyphomicrobiales bacterium]
MTKKSLLSISLLLFVGIIFITFSCKKNNHQESPKQLTTIYKDKRVLTSNMKEVLDNFIDIYFKSSSPEECKIVIEGYIHFIGMSRNLNEIEKQSLIGALSVASESPFFWMNQD